MAIWQFLFGPLAGIECRRALGRKWIPWVRLAGAGLLGGTLLVFVWFWWMAALFDPGYRPQMVMEIGLTVSISLIVVVALLLTPAMLAGSLAGEKDRGTLLMLLTSRTSPREIVSARLASRMAVVGVTMISGLPAVSAFGGWMGLPLSAALVTWLLPASVALGGGGLALAASTLARRGRDALMVIFLLDLALILGPALGASVIPPQVWEWLSALNPFSSIWPLAARGELRPAWATIAIWSGMGLAGIVFSAWRLAPIYIKQLEGRRPRRRHQRKLRLVDLSRRPMLWKELHTDLAGKPGWIVHGLGWVAVAGMVSLAAVLAGLTVWRAQSPDDPGAVYWHDTVKGWVGFSAVPLGWLIQWAVALRASVAIVSEREAETWDTLLTTPMEGPEIIWSKIGGSLYALRGLLAVTVICWTVALFCGAMQPADYWTYVATTFVIGAFMAAVGVWASMVSSTATQSMTIALGAWLAAALLFWFLAWTVVAVGALVLLFVWLIGLGMGLASPGGPGPLPVTPLGIAVTLRLAMYAAAAVGIGWFCRRFFDFLAGRAYARKAWTPRFVGPPIYAQPPRSHAPRDASGPLAPVLRGEG